MIVCEKCFSAREREIALIVGDRSNATYIMCPLCGAKNVKGLDTEKDSRLEGLFDDLLSVYTALTDLPDSFPKSETRMLDEIMREDWDIFGNIPDDMIITVLKTLSPDILKQYPALFEERLGILEKYDLDYLKENSVLRTDNWDDFAESIKHKNRFHTNSINTELLKKYCESESLTLEIKPDERKFYRGRIARNKKGYKPSEMGAPPIHLVGDGRANSAGISRLYLTDDKETILHEIRAAEYDYVTIGTFKLQETIKVVDLRLINNISPITSDDCTRLAINLEHFQKINDEMCKTMRRGDSPLDYLPTQYICDFIQSITDEEGNSVYQGIMYKSAMHEVGSNLVIFDPTLFRCTYTKTYEVTKLRYDKMVTK